MSSVMGYNRRSATANASIGSGSGGGDVDDILKRLGNVEGLVSELRSQVSGILALIPHLATKADVADLKAAVTQVKVDVASLETKMIKWIISTVLTSTALAFSIAKFVH
jgi:hypothetical protein